MLCAQGPKLYHAVFRFITKKILDFVVLYSTYFILYCCCRRCVRARANNVRYYRCMTRYLLPKTQNEIHTFWRQSYIPVSLVLYGVSFYLCIIYRLDQPSSRTNAKKRT